MPAIILKISELLKKKFPINEAVVPKATKTNEKPKVTYADRNGKYQGQKGVTLPKV